MLEGPVLEPPEYRRSEQLTELTVARGVKRWKSRDVGNPGKGSMESEGYPRSESLLLK